MKNLAKFFICFLVFVLLYLVASLLIFRTRADKELEEINHIREIEKVKYEKFIWQHDSSMRAYECIIDSLERLRGKTKLIYQEKIKLIPVQDTCQRWKVESEMYQFENHLLSDEVKYYNKALNSCDSQFTALLVYCDSSTTALTNEVNRLISDSVSQMNIIAGLNRKIKKKDKTIRVLIGIVVAEALGLLIK